MKTNWFDPDRLRAINEFNRPITLSEVFPSFTNDTKQTMTAPLPKHEMTIQRCSNNRAIAIDYATGQARDWAMTAQQFTHYKTMTANSMLGLPVSMTLIVSECYDVDEVFAYLASQPFVHVLP